MTTIVIACEVDALAVAQARLAHLQLPGFDDLGERDTLTTDSQQVARVVGDARTLYYVAKVDVPDETAGAIKRAFDPSADERADWDARIADERLRIQQRRAARAKAPADGTDADERALIREIRDVPGQLPSLVQMRSAASACRVWIRSGQSGADLEAWFSRPARADDGWVWVARPANEGIA